jgi:hypothetical protein
MVTYLTDVDMFEQYTGTAWARGNDVMVFVDDAARTSAIGTPVAGMATYLTGVAQFQVYNGTAWTQISGGSGGGPDFLLMGA